MLNVYLLGVLVNLGVMSCLALYVSVSNMRKKNKIRLIDNKLKAILILGLICLLSFSSTVFPLGALIAIIGEDVIKLGIEKKDYKTFALGKIMTLSYNKETFPKFIAFYSDRAKNKKMSFRKREKINDNYGYTERYYYFVMLRYQAIKKANKK